MFANLLHVYCTSKWYVDICKNGGKADIVMRRG